MQLRSVLQQDNRRSNPYLRVSIPFTAVRVPARRACLSLTAEKPASIWHLYDLYVSSERKKRDRSLSTVRHRELFLPSTKRVLGELLDALDVIPRRDRTWTREIVEEHVSLKRPARDE